MKNIKARIQHLHKTEAEWNLKTDFIPNPGELIIYDADSNNLKPRLKLGDGKTKLKNLPFISTEVNLDELFNSEEGIIKLDAGRISNYNN